MGWVGLVGWILGSLDFWAQDVQLGWWEGWRFNDCRDIGFLIVMWRLWLLAVKDG